MFRITSTSVTEICDIYLGVQMTDAFYIPPDQTGEDHLLVMCPGEFTLVSLRTMKPVPCLSALSVISAT